MSADSRVVGSVCLIGDPELYAHGEFASVQMQLFGGYIPKIGDKLTTLSLLAEAEERRDHWHDYSARRVEEIAALQSRLDAVVGLADRWERLAETHGVRTFTGNDHRLFANELRAALGCATTGEGK